MDTSGEFVASFTEADKLVSELHEALYAYDGQPHAWLSPEEHAWKLAREQMNGLICKLHNLLKGTRLQSGDKIVVNSRTYRIDVNDGGTASLTPLYSSPGNHVRRG